MCFWNCLLLKMCVEQILLLFRLGARFLLGLLGLVGGCCRASFIPLQEFSLRNLNRDFVSYCCCSWELIDDGETKSGLSCQRWVGIWGQTVRVAVVRVMDLHKQLRSLVHSGKTLVTMRCVEDILKHVSWSQINCKRTFHTVKLIC